MIEPFYRAVWFTETYGEGEYKWVACGFKFVEDDSCWYYGA